MRNQSKYFSFPIFEDAYDLIIEHEILRNGYTYTYAYYLSSHFVSYTIIKFHRIIKQLHAKSVNMYWHFNFVSEWCLTSAIEEKSVILVVLLQNITNIFGTKTVRIVIFCLANVRCVRWNQCSCASYGLPIFFFIITMWCSLCAYITYIVLLQYIGSFYLTHTNK